MISRGDDSYVACVTLFFLCVLFPLLRLQRKISLLIIKLYGQDTYQQVLMILRDFYLP